MDIQALLPWETPCVCLKHTRVRTHAHTEPGFTALYIYVPPKPALLTGAGVNPGTEKMIPNTSALCYHGNSILPSDIP